MLNSFSPFPSLSSPRPTPTIPHRFNEIKTIIFLGIEMRSRNSRVWHAPLHLCAWIAATNVRSYDFMIMYDHTSPFFRLPAIFLLLVCQKNVSGGYIVSAHLGKQHINLVIPIIGFVSFFITGELTNARKRLFDLHLMNTEDHLFQHNGLRANIFSTLDAGPSYSNQNPLIYSDCCDQ